MKFMRPTSSISARQIAWVLERVREGMIGQVPLHTLMEVDVAIDVLREGDLERGGQLLESIRHKQAALNLWDTIHLPASPAPFNPKLLWAAGRPTPHGNIDWQFGGMLQRRESYRLFRAHGIYLTNGDLFERTVTAGSHVWRRDDFPLACEAGVVDVSNEPQPFGRLVFGMTEAQREDIIHKRMPIWCAACDGWVNKYVPRRCPHIWSCLHSNFDALVTNVRQNIDLNHNHRLSLSCRKCRYCSRVPSIEEASERVAKDYKPNRGVGACFR